MATQIVYSDEFNKHNSVGHPENAKRLVVMIDEIKKSSFYNDLEIVKPEILPENLLSNVHSKKMIQQIKDMSMLDKSWIDLDTYVCKSSYKTARLAAGGLLHLCNNILNGKAYNGFALVRPPGHHATKNRSMGFCLFNNAAIAANEIAKQGKKVLIFDFDTHHGNGTQEIFYDRSDVLYQSLHLSPHYPGTGEINEIGIGKGEGYTVNVPLSYGHGDKAVTQILDEIFLPISEQFEPDFIIMSAGYDSHCLDPLGGLRFTTDFYGEMTKRLINIQPKVVGTLEGGYNLDWIGKCLVSQLAQMTGNKVKFDDTTDEKKDVTALIKELKINFRNYWNL